MKKENFVKAMMLAIILPSSVIASSGNDDATTNGEEKVIELTNNNGSGINENTLQVPVSATLSNNVLNVQFTGTVPMATVSVNKS